MFMHGNATGQTQGLKLGGGGGGGVTLPICAVINLEWAVIKAKLGSVKN